MLGTAPNQSEVFEWDFETRNMNQLTSSATASAPGPSWDPARTTDITQTSRPEFTAFVSTADHTGQNPDLNQEIFIRIRDTGEIRQITDTDLDATGAVVVNSDPFPSDSGRCIVFSSNADLNDNLGSLPNSGDGNPGPEDGPFTNADGSEEVFLAFLDTDANVEIGELTQISNGPAGTRSHRYQLWGTRDWVKLLTSQIALDWLRRTQLGEDPTQSSVLRR